MIITGHLWEFSYIPKDYVIPESMAFRGGFLWKLVGWMTPKGTYNSAFTTLFKRIRDPKVHAQQWNEVLKWDFQYGCSHHDPPGVCGPIDDPKIMDSEGGLRGDFHRKLDATGELTGEPVYGSWFPWKHANVIAKTQKKEPGFVKKYGKVPELRYGGPGYDANGFTK